METWLRADILRSDSNLLLMAMQLLQKQCFDGCGSAALKGMHLKRHKLSETVYWAKRYQHTRQLWKAVSLLIFFETMLLKILTTKIKMYLYLKPLTSWMKYPVCCWWLWSQFKGQFILTHKHVIIPTTWIFYLIIFYYELYIKDNSSGSGSFLDFILNANNT